MCLVSTLAGIGKDGLRLFSKALLDCACSGKIGKPAPRAPITLAGRRPNDRLLRVRPNTYDPTVLWRGQVQTTLMCPSSTRCIALPFSLAIQSGSVAIGKHQTFFREMYLKKSILIIFNTTKTSSGKNDLFSCFFPSECQRLIAEHRQPAFTGVLWATYALARVLIAADLLLNILIFFSIFRQVLIQIYLVFSVRSHSIAFNCPSLIVCVGTYKCALQRSGEPRLRECFSNKLLKCVDVMSGVSSKTSGPLFNPSNDTI